MSGHNEIGGRQNFLTMISLLFGVFTPCFTPNTFVLDVFFFLKQVTYNHVESIVRFNFNTNTVQSVSGCGYNLDLITDNVMSFFKGFKIIFIAFVHTLANNMNSIEKKIVIAYVIAMSVCVNHKINF